MYAGSNPSREELLLHEAMEVINISDDSSANNAVSISSGEDYGGSPASGGSRSISSNSLQFVSAPPSPPNRQPEDSFPSSPYLLQQDMWANEPPLSIPGAASNQGESD